MSCNHIPPAPWLLLDEAHINKSPESEGVLQLLDADRNVLSIKGTLNLRQELLAALKDHQNATHFCYEEDKMISQRESELLQQYLQQHGWMPDGQEEDLF